MNRIYISGKISGIESEAPALFQAAENYLNSVGYEAVNPMKIEPKHDKSWSSFMREDIKELCDCDEIYMLCNWKTSEGAKLELYIAEKLGLKINYQ